MNRILALGIAALCISNSASAHDFWLEPSAFIAEVPASVSLGLRVGENFSGRGVRRQAATIANFVVAGPGGQFDVPGLEGRDPAGYLRIDQAGDYVVGYETRGQAIELAAKRFESYLRHEGLDHVVETRRASGQSDRPGREIFVRCAKTLVHAGGAPNTDASSQERSLGLTLELLLEANSDSYRFEDGLPVRLLFRGKPIQDALIVGLRRGQTESPISGRTNEHGRVTIPLSLGEWLLKAVHMVPADQESTADWKSYWASITFSTDSLQVRPKPDPEIDPEIE